MFTFIVIIKIVKLNASYIRVTIERGGFKHSKRVRLIHEGGLYMRSANTRVYTVCLKDFKRIVGYLQTVAKLLEFSKI